MSRKKEPVSVSNWMTTMFIMCLPVINLIMLFVWAFGDGAPPSKTNWARATLIWMLMGVAMYIFLFLILGVGAYWFSKVAGS